MGDSSLHLVDILGSYKVMASGLDISGSEFALLASARVTMTRGVWVLALKESAVVFPEIESLVLPSAVAAIA